LTALGRDEISDELDKLAVERSDYLEILRSRARVQGIIKDELGVRERNSRRRARPRSSMAARKARSKTKT
jgi:DNA gyrase/topoisomerase IV subunit A